MPNASFPSESKYPISLSFFYYSKLAVSKITSWVFWKGNRSVSFKQPRNDWEERRKEIQLDMKGTTEIWLK